MFWRVGGAASGRFLRGQGIPGDAAGDRFWAQVASGGNAAAPRVSIPGLRGGVGGTRVRADGRRRDRSPPALRISQQPGGRGVAPARHRTNGERA